MGADRQLRRPRHRAVLRAGRRASDRVGSRRHRPTTDGHRTIAAIVSAPENIRNLERIRPANQRLADPRTIAPEDARRWPPRTRPCSPSAPAFTPPKSAPRRRPTSCSTSSRPRTTRAAGHPAERRRHPDSVAQSGRSSAGGRLVRETEGHGVRGRPDAVALSQVRRPRHQSRRLHDEPGGEPQSGAVFLHRSGIRRCF